MMWTQRLRPAYSVLVMLCDAMLYEEHDA